MPLLFSVLLYVTHTFTTFLGGREQVSETFKIFSLSLGVLNLSVAWVFLP